MQDQVKKATNWNFCHFRYGKWRKAATMEMFYRTGGQQESLKKAYRLAGVKKRSEEKLRRFLVYALEYVPLPGDSPLWRMSRAKR
jgi:hypothetical protein